MLTRQVRVVGPCCLYQPNRTAKIIHAYKLLERLLMVRLNRTCTHHQHLARYRLLIETFVDGSHSVTLRD